MKCYKFKVHYQAEEKPDIDIYKYVENPKEYAQKLVRMTTSHIVVDSTELTMDEALKYTVDNIHNNTCYVTSDDSSIAPLRKRVFNTISELVDKFTNSYIKSYKYSDSDLELLKDMFNVCLDKHNRDERVSRVRLDRVFVGKWNTLHPGHIAVPVELVTGGTAIMWVIVSNINIRVSYNICFEDEQVGTSYRLLVPRGKHTQAAKILSLICSK